MNEQATLLQLPRQISPHDPPARDLDAAADGARMLLTGLGVDLTGTHTTGTAERMVKALAEMLTPQVFDPTLFDSGAGTDLVLVSGIGFNALCAHHVLPFTGTADIAYIPGEQVIGLSKLPRATASAAARLQVQEEFTTDLADWVQTTTGAGGVGVRVRAQHLCMSCRGARSTAETTTVATRGLLATDPARRAEWLGLLATAVA
ncbi:GTP cyclohydrolase I [Longispora sp. NPDC051575]|uniref:GTP cyclohydrolase I n=1 Tax=Longispora sp. NPDC051575 TaxID=3154943 RepID=UPI00341587A0